MLDDAAIARIDAGDMLRLVREFPAMTADGWRAAQAVATPATRPSAIVACGMGGSGIGGDLLRALAAPVAPMPVIVAKSDRMPAFVDPTTLALLCSYSGNTEETLAAYASAARAGAHIVAVTSGGQLERQAREAGHSVITVPGGRPPRSALPLLLMPMVRVAAATGAVSVTDDDVREVVALLDQLAAAWGSASKGGNAAQAVAASLDGAVPVVYATTSFTEAAALRWKTQLAENSKTLALDGAFPEITHNDVVGWEGAAPGLPWHVVLLRDRDEGPRDALRLGVTRELALRRAAGCTEVWSEGQHPLARLLSLVLFGDFVTCYLAVRRGIDPTPVGMIDRIKARLGAGGTDEDRAAGPPPRPGEYRIDPRSMRRHPEG